MSHLFPHLRFILIARHIANGFDDNKQHLSNNGYDCQDTEFNRAIITEKAAVTKINDNTGLQHTVAIKRPFTLTACAISSIFHSQSFMIFLARGDCPSSTQSCHRLAARITSGSTIATTTTCTFCVISYISQLISAPPTSFALEPSFRRPIRSAPRRTSALR